MTENTLGIFSLSSMTARRFDKMMVYYAKVRVGETEIRTEPTKFVKAVTWPSDFSVSCASNDKLKITIYKTRGEDKKAESVASGMIDVSLFIKDSQLRIKLKSKLHPNSTLQINAKFDHQKLSSRKLTLSKSKPPSNNNNNNNNNNSPINYSVYDPLQSLMVDKELEFLNAVCETTNYLDLDDISIAMVYLFYSQGKILELIKWAIRKELKNTDKEELLFRGQTVYIKMMSDFATLVGKNYLTSMLKPIVTDMSNLSSEQSVSFEVNPNRVDSDLEANRERIKSYSKKFLETITTSEDALPSSIREVCRQLHRIVKKRFPNSVDIVIGGFLFLRFICPTIVAPEQSGLLDSPPNMNFRRGLVLCAKLLQNLASGVTFGEKESYMEPFNPFINENMEPMHSFFSAVRKKGEKEMKDDVTISPDELHKHLVRLHIYLTNHHAEIEQLLPNEMAEELAKLLSELGPPPNPNDQLASPRTSDYQRNRSTFFTRFQSIFRS